MFNTGAPVRLGTCGLTSPQKVLADALTYSNQRGQIMPIT